MRKWSSVGRLLSKIKIRNFCACTQKTSTSLLRIYVYAQIIQCWKTLLSKIVIRNFCTCTQKSSTSLLRICVYAQKIQQMIIIKSSNNPIVDVLRPAQKLQVWNTHIPAWGYLGAKIKFRPAVCPLCYLLLNHWMKFNQIYVCELLT